MTRTQRIALLAGGVLVAVAAFLILQPEDDDEPAREASHTAPAEQQQEATSAEAGETPPAPRPKPKPKFTQIRIRGGEPVGGEAKVSVEKGDTIRLAVRSDVAEEVHVHGYDLSRPVAPGKPVRMAFEANLEGIFEVELEHSAVPIASLEVTP